jgi:Trypsin-like peptidase domain
MADPRSKQIFAKILTRYVPQASVHTTLDAVLPPDIEGDARQHFIEKLLPEALNDLPRQMEALAEELSRRQLLDKFIQTLLRSRAMDVRLQGIFSGEVDIDAQGDVNSGQVQSLTNKRMPFVNSKVFGDFIVSTRHRICAIWIRSNTTQPGGEFKGTGFLIAPDLVMTAHHVLTHALTKTPDPAKPEEMIDTPRPGALLKCVFDYWMPIAANGVAGAPPAEVTVIDTPANWLVWHRVRHPKDGVSHMFDFPPNVHDRLDCAIIRLAKPVGAEAFATGGGRMRGWVKLPDPGIAQVVKDDPIAILQHPAGGPQGMDKGVYFDTDPTESRIWYTTQAAQGSSGSPCFDAEATIVGFHNAGHPTGFNGATKECNQGVRMDHVVAALPPEILKASRDGKIGEIALWSLSDDTASPIPVLGRTEFRAAVVQLFDPQSKKRIIVVDEAKEAASTGRSGKTFSAGILKAIARDRPALVIEFPARDLAKLSPEEFLAELGRRIGIDKAQFATLPPRPSGERQVARWLSTELPDWFGQLIEERALPAAVAAQQQVPAGLAGAEAGNDAAPATGRELVIKELVWIVIDDIHKSPPERGLKELLAGMAGVTDTQQVLRPGLKALRWLMIGHVPDFVRDRVNEYIPDTVSPTAIGKPEWVDCLRTYFLSSGEAGRFNDITAQALYDFSIGVLPGTQDPTSRLATIAAAVPQAIRAFPPAG